MKLLNKLKNNITGRKLIIVTIIFAITMIAINIISIQLNGLTLDFELGYSVEKTYRVIHDLSVDGRKLYVNILKLDFLFPITYMIFGISLISYLLKRFGMNRNRLRVLILVPIFAMIYDWIENIIIIFMINDFPVESVILASARTTFTILKFSFLCILILSAIILIVINFIRKQKK